ncbi:DUF560 domain-containing protein [Marinobacter halodurans]|uniref:DUF560 domain-containing protein n=1 Tax=Marinobacter halodurans TaxID=2528979 RepID=A0ABY1ZQ23_9GAMM|nr:surface lipoprotein assembly modifier [Marinobacter halodurans]TBW59031.1 DUF560 domain-containing protein [Marinobacter halodurans]
MQRSTRWLTLAFVTASASVPVQAASFDGYAETGAEYDSNLNVDELDQASGESDQSLLLGAGAEASGHPVKHLTLTGTYDFTSRNYTTFDAFDQTIHLASLDLNYDFDVVTVGASHHYSHATLDSDPFLDYNRSSVYLGKLVDDDVYLMLSLLRKKKAFDDSDARDARTRGISLDSYFFYNQNRTLLLLGLEGDRQDAASDAYDYRMLAARARFKHRFSVAGHDNTFQVGVRYEDRDYDDAISTVEEPRLPVVGTSVTTTETRSDRILVANVRWAVGLTDWLTTEAKVERTDHRSSLDSADYGKTVSSLTLRADF